MLVMSRGALSAGQAETYYEENTPRTITTPKSIESPVSGSAMAPKCWAFQAKSLTKIFARYFAANGRATPKFSSATPMDELNGGQDGTRPSTRPSRSAFRRWQVETPN